MKTQSVSCSMSQIGFTLRAPWRLIFDCQCKRKDESDVLPNYTYLAAQSSRNSSAPSQRMLAVLPIYSFPAFQSSQVACSLVQSLIATAWNSSDPAQNSIISYNSIYAPHPRTGSPRSTPSSSAQSHPPPDPALSHIPPIDPSN